MKCTACGVDLVADASFCQKCGHRVGGAAASTGGTTAAEKMRASMQPRDDSALDAEEELWKGGFAAKSMAGTWCVVILMSMVLLVVGALTTIGLPVCLGIAVVMWLALGLYVLYQKIRIRYTLTSQRFVHESGILVRTTDRIEVIEIDDVTFTQGLVERMLGVGTIKITSSDRTHPEIWLRGIDEVQRVAKLIDDVRLRVRRRRGVHIEQI